MSRDPVARLILWSGILCLAILLGLFAFGFWAVWFRALTGLVIILGLILAIPIVACALILLAWGIILIFRARGLGARALAACAAPVLLFVTMVASFPMLFAGRMAGIHVRLALDRASYDAIVEQVRAAAGGHVGIQKGGGMEYFVDDGPPKRVAFNPEGMLDNWSGIVFDPTGIVVEADGFDPVTGAFAARNQVTKLFGGDLVRCRHLADQYYFCSFT